MDFEALANSFWFVVSAHIAAFLPWTATASTDFISSKWISVRRTRIAGYRNLIWTLFPLAYVVFYAVVQGKAKEYSEMSAAVVAAVFATLIGIRTIWGLWQLHLFHSWSCRSIEALRAVGVEYSLLRLQRRRKRGGLTGERMKSEDIADEILVSEKIIDNQISHGDVQCFIKFRNITLLKSSDSDPLPTLGNRALQSLQDVLLALLDPLYMLIPWLLIPAAIAVEFVLVVVGRRKPKKLSMIPKEPVEVWVHWASAFAAQGLQKWMADFEVAVNPEIAPEFVRKRAVEQFHARGKYFGAQLLASAALQLWTEDGNMHGMSPMLWDGWKKDSHMSDGLVVKQELFQEAIRAGKCLPFGAPQPRSLDLRNTNVHHSYYSYDAYQDVLGEFVSDLPVRYCFVKEMRKFDVNMFEWLTILLHLGYCAVENERRRNRERDDSHEVGADIVESTSHERDASTNVDRDTFRGAEATKNLRSQLGVTRDKVLVPQSGVLSEGEGPLRIPPILRDVSSAVSENNRLVTKAGQLIDVWLSLVCGDQIWFLVEKLNDNWKEICFGRAGTNTETCGDHKNWDLREAHKQLERRRLERRLAYENGRRYHYLDQYVTFMGYRMESVRTVLGRWLDFAGGKSVDDLLVAATNGRMNHTGIEIKLSDSIYWLLNDVNRLEILGRKGVQCRLVWEVQNNLETMLLSFQYPKLEEVIEPREIEKMGLAAMMLLLLSFPGLRVEILQQERGNRDWIAIDMNSLGGARNDSRELKRTRTDQSGTRGETIHSNVGVCVIVHVVCGPQDVSLKIDIDGSCKCTLTLLQNGEGKLEWRWWRDAFSGRLDGFKEWQEDLGISPITLNTSKMENDGLSFKAMDTAWDTEVRVWAEWPPFRPQFCRFELETREFLKQPITVGHKNLEDNTTGFIFGRLPLQAIQAVSYADAHERVLRDSSLLVQESLKISRSEKVNEGGLVWKPESAGIMLENIPPICDEYEESRALMLHKFDALHSEKAESLKECMKILCTQFDSESNVSEAIELLQSFIGTILLSSSLEVRRGREAEVEEVILPVCEELIRRYFGSERQIECLLIVIQRDEMSDRR